MEVYHDQVKLLDGKEPFFADDGKEAGFSVLDFWRFQFSNLPDMQGRVGEFIVAKALEKDKPENNNGWTLWDIDYRGKKIEVKTTAYFQPWRFKRDENGNIIDDGEKNYSEIRTFSIRKANGDEDGVIKYKRWSDIYVFVLDIGTNEKDANPLELKNWRFWVIETTRINEICKDNKSISLSKLTKLCPNYKEGLCWSELKNEIDNIINNSK